MLLKTLLKKKNAGTGHSCFSHIVFNPSKEQAVIFYLYKFKTFADDNFNSLPNDKILDWSKVEAFADDKN